MPFSIRIRLLAFLGLLAGGAGTCAGAAVTLVEQGKPRAAIVLDAERPTRAAQFAAFELQHVIRLITDAELPIVRGPDGVAGAAILVGDSQAARALGYPDRPFRGEEYLVAVDRDRIVLMGHDSPDTGQVDYADPSTFPAEAYTLRSTTYAVYEFLETCCGVRFYGFGDDGIALDKRETLVVEPRPRRAAPAMDAFRRPYFSTRFTVGLSPRDRLLLQLRWRVNTLFGECNHNVYSIYWRYWGKAVSPDLAKLFVEKRPRYFAKGYEGAFAANDLRGQYPTDPDLPPQLCNSDHGPVEYFADEALRVYRGETIPGGYGNHVRVLSGYPWYYPIQEQDSSQWCQCEACQALFGDVASDRRYNYIHFDWINRIAEAAARLDPAIGISTLAYSGTLPHPDPAMLTLRTNVSVQLCLGIQSWYHPHIYARQHAAYKAWVEQEAGRRPLTVWLYLLCPAWDARMIYKYNQFFPMLYPRRAGHIVQEFARDGIRGFFAEIDPTFHLLEAYVINRISLDPDLDVDTVIDEHFQRYYGAAAEPMKRFYDSVESITWSISNYPAATLHRVPKSSFTYGLHTEQANWHLGTPERIAALQKLIDQAEQQAATPLEQRRVRAFVHTVWTQAVEGRKAFEARELVRAVPLPRVTCDYAGECGGDPDRVDFEAAAPSGGWTLTDGSPLGAKPRLAFASDSQYFYFRYEESGDTAVKHRDAGLWVNNLEVFLAAQPDVPYGQLALSPTGGLAALRHEIVEGVLRSEAWDVKPAVRQRLDSNGWSVAVALPLAGLLPGRPVEPGARLYANFMRTRRFDNQASWSWSPVFADGYAQSLHRMGTIFLAPLVPGGEFPVNGAFASTNGIVPDGWILNRPAGPDADQSAAAREGRFLLAGGSNALHAYHQTLQPARRGDRIVLEFTVAGTGQGAAGVYLNAGGGDGAGSRIEQWPLTPEPQPHSLTVTVHHASPDRFVAGFRPVLGAAPRSRAEFSGFRVRLLPRGSDAPGPYHDSE